MIGDSMAINMTSWPSKVTKIGHLTTLCQASGVTGEQPQPHPHHARCLAPRRRRGAAQHLGRRRGGGGGGAREAAHGGLGKPRK